MKLGDQSCIGVILDMLLGDDMDKFSIHLVICELLNSMWNDQRYSATEVTPVVVVVVVVVVVSSHS